MIRLPLDQVRQILCLGAHSDDIEIGCGGTLLKLLAQRPGLTVHWVILGAHGDRADEARQSAERFLSDAAGARVDVRGFRDSYFPYIGGEIKDFFHELGGRVAPDLVFTHRREDLHQDHRLTAELTWNVFRNHLILEYEIPKYEGDLGAPNVFVPLEEATCGRKVAAIMEHFRTQHEKHWFCEDLFWSVLRLRGAESNSPTRFAEAFTCRKMTIG